MGVGPLAQIRRLPLPSIGRLARPRLDLLVARGWAADANRRALWLPAAFAAGIALYFSLAAEPAWWWARVTLGGGLGFAAAAASLPRRPLIRGLLALIASFGFGFADAQYRTQAVAAPVLLRKAGPLKFTGRLESIDVHRDRLRLVIASVSPLKRLGAAGTPAKVRVTMRPHDDGLQPGDWVQVTAMLMPPPEPATPGGYDFGRAAYFMRIGAVGYMYGYPHRVQAPRADTWFEAWNAAVERLRLAITMRIIGTIGGREGAISAALVTGKRGAIEDDDNSAFRDAGLAHVLVIAGVHLSLAAGFFFWLVRAILAAFPPIALRYPIKKIAAVAAMFGACILLIISGSGEPAMRATVMLCVMFASIIADRPAFSMRSVALAATIILFLQPEGIVSAGFQLSFAAVIGLIARAEWSRTHKHFDEGLPAPPSRLSHVWRYAGGVAMTSTVAGIATAPFSIFHFDRAAQYGILGNILAMPVVGTVVMPAATVAIVLMPFGLDRWPLIVMGKGVSATLFIAHFVSGLPGAAAMVPAWPYAALTLTAFGGLWWALWQARWRWLGLIPIIAGIALGLQFRQPDVLVSRDGRDVVVRQASGRLAFLRPPSDGFSADAVLKRDGDTRDPADAIGGPGVRCDWQGCTARLAGGQLLAASARLDALMEDCRHADIVIASVPARHRCHGPKLVIDRFDVARNGAYALTLGTSLKTETVRAWRGERPWSAHAPPRKRVQYRRINPTSLP